MFRQYNHGPSESINSDNGSDSGAFKTRRNSKLHDGKYHEYMYAVNSGTHKYQYNGSKNNAAAPKNYDRMSKIRNHRGDGMNHKKRHESISTAVTSVLTQDSSLLSSQLGSSNSSGMSLQSLSPSHLHSLPPPSSSLSTKHSPRSRSQSLHSAVTAVSTRATVARRSDHYNYETESKSQEEGLTLHSSERSARTIYHDAHIHEYEHECNGDRQVEENHSGDSGDSGTSNSDDNGSCDGNVRFNKKKNNSERSAHTIYHDAHNHKDHEYEKEDDNYSQYDKEKYYQSSKSNNDDDDDDDNDDDDLSIQSEVNNAQSDTITDNNITALNESDLSLSPQYPPQYSLHSSLDNYDIPSHSLSSANKVQTKVMSSPPRQQQQRGGRQQQHHPDFSYKNLDIPHCILSSAQQLERNISETLASPFTVNTLSIPKQSYSFWDTLKNFFSQDLDNNNYQNKRLFILSPPPTKTSNITTKNEQQSSTPSSSSLFCTNICTKSLDSPLTPEYERRCRDQQQHDKDNFLYYSNRIEAAGATTVKTELSSLSSPQSRSQPSVPKTQQKIQRTDNDVAFMKTVKKKNGMKNDVAFMKTVKKKNGYGNGNDNDIEYGNENSMKSTSTDVTANSQQSYVIADETQRNNHFFYQGNHKAADFIEQDKECYFRGFDGKHCHYTYVSPKKDAGLPMELEGIVTITTSPRNLGLSPPFSPVAEEAARKRIDFQSLDIQKATTVLHVISPKKDSNDTTDEGKANIDCEDEGSVSMISDERNMVTGYLQNANHSNVWLEKKKKLLKDSEELNQRIPSWPQRRKRELRKMMASNYGNNESSISNSHVDTDAVATIEDNDLHQRRFSTLNDNYQNDDQTVHTYGTMATNGTLHRRKNSTSVFTVDSLARIFHHETQYENEPKNWDELTIGNATTPPGCRGFVPKTVRKLHYDKDVDEESLISPLGENEENINNTFQFNDTKFITSLIDEWSNTKVVKEVILPPEPNGIYMPKCSVFKDDVDVGHRFCTLEGWLAFSKGSRLIDSLQEDEENINRKDLRYIVIEGNQLYVYTSKKNDPDVSLLEGGTVNSKTDSHNSVKILKLSKDLKVEMKFISKRHGHSVCVTDMATSKMACTLLPVRLTSEYFRDKENSQVVSSKKFKKLRSHLFGINTTGATADGASASCEQGQVLHDVSNCGRTAMTRCNSQKYNESEKLCSSSWPSSMPQIAPEQQNTSALCLQFGLDAAKHG